MLIQLSSKFQSLMFTEIMYMYIYINSEKMSSLNHNSQSFIMLINVEMPTIVSNSALISKINFMLS